MDINMSFSDKKHGPNDIVKLAREADYRGDYIYTSEQIAELIDTYGKVRYAEGISKDMGR